jgi:hypothetical protein
MFGPASIGIACPIPKERAAFVEWLEAAGYKPVLIHDLRTLATDLENRPIEALLADANAVAKIGLGALLRILTSNRPLVIVGTLNWCPPELRHMASWLDRPVSMSDLTLGVALALAEGRPARRSARKSVLHLPATVDGVNSQVLDVSNEGVRLRVKSTTASTLPPYFTLRVEVFGVATLVGHTPRRSHGSVRRHHSASPTQVENVDAPRDHGADGGVAPGTLNVNVR